MALVGYESSDEEEEVEQQPEPKSLKQTQDTTSHTNEKPNDIPEKPSAPIQKSDEQQPAIIGPQIGPSAITGPSFPPLEEAPMDDDDDANGPGLPPGSPYTATRALLRDLTLPTVPNTEIPPEPPGEPPAALSAKFERFLELKKQGVHFNSRVAANPALRNPALTDKLLSFVELGSPVDQYRTTLSADIWDPTAFPRHAYKEQLKQSQAEIEKARARNKGAPVEFVAATTSASNDQAIQQKPSVGKRKTRFDA
ncbi:HCNGP-like protein-domain-containing protein [Hypoxylon trugodes]|uniref:HCNGP-like protein-domain-containing protein n=1 Tax=Hypoxylon trugodes TaxID=326681 RepID=UPI0021983D90|nr:HCNGP-like protein-domain-containing protein [Hypoxylon trugodes]KAI1390309.1 HCNGP-like protein-domain-containing protein [Hypoxylon trugodes]